MGFRRLSPDGSHPVRWIRQRVFPALSREVLRLSPAWFAWLPVALRVRPSFGVFSRPPWNWRIGSRAEGPVSVLRFGRRAWFSSR